MILQRCTAVKMLQEIKDKKDQFKTKTKKKIEIISVKLLESFSSNDGEVGDDAL